MDEHLIEGRTMTEKYVLLTVELSPEEKKTFSEIANSFGFSEAEVLMMLVHQFIECKELPFVFHCYPKINYKNPNLLHAHLNDKGRLIVPNAWKDEDE